MTHSPVLRVIHGPAGLEEALGEELGVSPWLTVDQEMITQFGTVTGDEQWLHLDPVRAASGPFGGTIAHGFLLLALIPQLANQVYEATGFSARVNYGVEHARFPRPLRSGEQVRNRVTLVNLEHTRSGTRATFGHHFEVPESDRPVLVAQTIILFTPAAQ